MDSARTIFDLGDDLVIEIFLRLPPESIFQYLSVSKQWNSLLASPEFLSHYSRRFHHRQRTPRSPHNLLGFFLDLNFSGATRVPFLSTQQSRISRENFSSDMGSFITSSNGLVLCRRGHTHPRSYHILNPMTRKHVSLPPSRRNYHHDIRPIGLSCDEDSDDLTPRYQVVIAHVPRTAVDNKLCIETYSSETKEWRESVLVATSDVRRLSFHPPTVVNGVFYWWVAFDFVAVYDPHNKLQRGNKDPNHLQLIQLPAYNLHYVLYQTPDGRLIFVRTSNGLIKIWELSKGELGFWRETTIYKQEWVLELVVLIPCNPLILLVRQGRNMFQYNTETRVMEHIVLLPENHTVDQPFFEATSFSSYLLA